MENYLYQDEDIIFSHATDEAPNPDNFQLHIHNMYEVFCFCEGSAEYQVEGHVYPLMPGRILIMRPGEIHRIHFLSLQPYTRYAIHFSEKLLLSLDPGKLLLRPFHERDVGQRNCYHPQEFSGIHPQDLLESMISTGGSQEERRLRILCGFFPFLGQLLTAFTENPTEPHKHHTETEEIVAYINNHLFEPLSLSLLSEKFFLSPSQINRKFTRITGSSVGRYIGIKRLYHARELLRNGKSAQETCTLCGFRDYSTFFRAYKKYFHLSPGEESSVNVTDDKLDWPGQLF